MGNLNEFNQRLELRDATGHTVGFLVPSLANPDLATECDRLRAELAQVRTERDECREALHALIQEHPFFAPQRLMELAKNGLTLRQIIDQIEPIIHGQPHG